MTPLPIRLAAFGLALAKCAAGLSVTPGSQCEAACANDDSLAATTDSDIVCQDNEYSTTEAGRRFKACVDCLRNSEHTNGSDSDLSALLFNFRTAAETCLFNDDGTSEITGCLGHHACLPLEDPIAFDDFEPRPEDMYGYCTAEDKSFLGRHTQSCLTCLQSSDEHVFVANFLTVLTGGCAYKPEAGDTLRFTGDVFSHDEILVKAPGQDDGETIPLAHTDDDSSPGLSREFTIGIVVGISLLFAIAILLFFIYYLRFRKRDEPPGPRPRRSLRHEPSIDPDPALFSSWRHPWGSDSDGESEGSGADYFDYVNAAAMAQKTGETGADGTGMRAHAAYKPYIKSRNDSLAVEGDRATGQGSASEGVAAEGSRGPSPAGRV